MGDLFLCLHNAGWFSPGQGIWSLCAFCIILVLAQTVLIPVSLFSVYAGFTFGFWHGTSVILAAKMMSALVNFSLSRWIARDWGVRLASKYPLVQGMNDVLVREGLQFTILLRLCPIPFGIANYGCGLTRMRLRSFLIATFVSIIIPSTTLAALGASLQEGLSALNDSNHHHSAWQLAGTGVSLLALTLVARRITRFAMERVREARKTAVPPPTADN
jgi:uncharacterized membrane protein YdjX (TVP38/TMEM64 family)